VRQDVLDAAGVAWAARTPTVDADAGGGDVDGEANEADGADEAHELVSPASSVDERAGHDADSDALSTAGSDAGSGDGADPLPEEEAGLQDTGSADASSSDASEAESSSGEGDGEASGNDRTEGADLGPESTP
jgi:hypothetical protein